MTAKQKAEAAKWRALEAWASAAAVDAKRRSRAEAIAQSYGLPISQVTDFLIKNGG